MQRSCTHACQHSRQLAAATHLLHSHPQEEAVPTLHRCLPREPPAPVHMALSTKPVSPSSSHAVVCSLYMLAPWPCNAPVARSVEEGPCNSCVTPSPHLQH
jgi:hypothetical protein